MIDALLIAGIFAAFGVLVWWANRSAAKAAVAAETIKRQGHAINKLEHERELTHEAESLDGGNVLDLNDRLRNRRD